VIPLPDLSPGDLARFWHYVSRGEGCWEWTGKAVPPRRGRGSPSPQFSVKARWYYASRIAYLIQYGVDPGDLQVNHTCDNPMCVRGEHLYRGTQIDNMRDCVERGRYRNPMSGRTRLLSPRGKLSQEQVDEIVQAYLTGGRTQQSLADEYGIDQTTVSGYVCAAREGGI
jgi:hypothetical protein